MKTRISTACRIAFALLLAYSNTGFALGLSPREAWLRQDLQALTDTQHLQSLTSTWPIPWPQLKHALAEVNVATLPPYLAAAHSRLTHHLEQQTATLRLRTTVRGSSTPPVTTTFGPYHTEIASISTGIGFTANRTSGQLHLRATHDRSDPQTAQFDDSFFLQRLGNWGIGVDTVDRWWGPAWRSSLILSHNTRPIPTIFLNRQSLDPFDQAWLHWLGPWRLMTFMGRLESSRHIPNALLWGARFTFSPHPRWEVGLSRTATWAGDGRPANFDAFTDLLLGHDNFELDDPDKISEPGNQLAGIDLRYAQPIGNASVAMYTQVIGEDEAGNLPSRPILLLG
ncbi:MAG: capsule assembly Wzi family protein, partial [Gammaproteobacteria bacterium]